MDMWMSRLVSVVVKVMGEIFPELKQGESNIKDIIAEEETSFGKTLVKVIDNMSVHDFVFSICFLQK